MVKKNSCYNMYKKRVSSPVLMPVGTVFSLAGAIENQQDGDRRAVPF